MSSGLAVELAGRLKLPVDAVEGFLSFLVDYYLVKYPSVGVLRLTVDLLSMGGDVRVGRFLNALGIGSGVRPTLNDPSFSRLYNAVATVVRLLDKAGLVVYNSAMGVVDAPGATTRLTRINHHPHAPSHTNHYTGSAAAVPALMRLHQLGCQATGSVSTPK